MQCPPISRRDPRERCAGGSNCGAAERLWACLLYTSVNCYIAYTNPATHKVILDNLHRSPLYGGDIQGVGPRYCPSIEDKGEKESSNPGNSRFVSRYSRP